MNSALKFFLLFFLVSGNFLLNKMVSAAEEPVATNSVVMENDENASDPSEATDELYGEVVSVDVKALKLVVKFPKEEEEEEVYQKMIFEVMPQAEILKNGETIALPDLKEGDDVVIEYITDAQGNGKISSIIVE